MVLRLNSCKRFYIGKLGNHEWYSGLHLKQVGLWSKTFVVVPTLEKGMFIPNLIAYEQEQQMVFSRKADKK